MIIKNNFIVEKKRYRFFCYATRLNSHTGSISASSISATGFSTVDVVVVVVVSVCNDPEPTATDDVVAVDSPLILLLELPAPLFGNA